MRRTWVALLVAALACSSHRSTVTAEDAGDDAGGQPDAGDCPTGDDTIGEAGVAPFQDIAQAAGLPAVGDSCMAFEDLDGDGHVDVLLATPANLVLYLGDGAGGFHARPIPFTPFAATGAAGTGTCAVGDVDADGKPDIVLTSVGAIEAHYLHNLGGGSFQDTQTLVPPLPTAYGIMGAGLADFDGDGRLDLVVAAWSLDNGLSTGSATCGCVPDGYACVIPGTRCLPPPVVYLNDGTGGFTTTPHSLGSPSDCGPANTNALGIADYDGDGRPDVFIADDWGTDRLYLNGTGMQFTEVWSTLGTKGYNHAMGVAFEDFDRDGRLDVYVSDIGSDQLYLGTGSGLAFHGEDWGVAAPTRFHSGWAPLAEDFDSDGWLDVYLASSALVGSYADLAAI
ncbi:MAG TPA: VCBS repeat-containing protein, partial [Polyangiaceae bacterium]